MSRNDQSSSDGTDSQQTTPSASSSGLQQPVEDLDAILAGLENLDCAGSDASDLQRQGWQKALQFVQQPPLCAQMPLPFDFRASMLVNTVLNSIEGGFENLVRNYLQTTHSWLCMIHEQRYLQRLASCGGVPDAEFAIMTLAMYLGSPATDKFKDGKEDKTFLDGVYRAVKELHRFRSDQGPCFLMVISGVLIALYEIWHGRNDTTRSSLGITASAAYYLGLDLSASYTSPSHAKGTSLLEERKRVWWGLIVVDR